MGKGTNSRNSGIELLRIILMFCIVLGHAVSQSQAVFDEYSVGNHLFVNMFGMARPATMCFIILSGLYSSANNNVEHEYHKLIIVWVKYVCVVTITTMVCIALFKEDRIYIKYSLFPLTWSPLWYVSCYILFLAFVPVVNAAYLFFEKDVRTRNIIACYVGGAVFGIGTLYPVVFGLSTKGFAPFYSELLVYISAYIIIKFCKETIEKVKSIYWQIIFWSGYLFFVVVKMDDYFQRKAYSVPRLYGLDKLIRIVSIYYSHIETIPLFLFALSLIMLWRRVEFKSRWLNRISSATLIVYIIHQHPLLWPHLWDEVFCVNKMAYKSTLAFAGYMLFVFMVLYLDAMIVNGMLDYVINMVVMKVKRRNGV